MEQNKIARGDKPNFQVFGDTPLGINLVDGSWLSRIGEMDFKVEGLSNSEKYCWSLLVTIVG